MRHFYLVKFLLLFTVCSLSAQTFTLGSNTWDTPQCTGTSNAILGYNDICVAANTKPAGTYFPVGGGVWERDSVFGSKVKMLNGPNCINDYSSKSNFSRRNTYGHCYYDNSGGGATYSGIQVFNISTGAHVRALPAHSQAKGWWGSLDDDKFYYMSGTTIYRYSISAGGASGTAVVSLAGALPGTSETMTEIAMGDADPSKDGWVAFGQRASSNQLSPICVMNPEHPTNPQATLKCRSIEADLGMPDGTQIDWVKISKGIDSTTGRRYLIVGSLGTYPSGVYWFTENDPITLDHIPEEVDVRPGYTAAADDDGICEPDEQCLKAYHSDVVELADGSQAYVRTVDGGAANVPGQMGYTSGRILMYFLFRYGERMFGTPASGGGARVIYRIHAQVMPSSHTGCARGAPVCVTSTNDNTNNVADGSTAVPVDAGGQRMVVAYNLSEGWVKRAANTRRVGWSSDAYSTYWSYAMCNVSYDGNLASCNTNFGMEEKVYRLIVDISADEKNLRVHPTATGLNVYYNAPAAGTACTVTVDNDADFSSPLAGYNAQADTAGTNARMFPVTGLPGQTEHSVRVNCNGVAVQSRVRTR